MRMTTNLDVAFLYLAASVPALIAAVVVESLVLWVAPQMLHGFMWALNFLPAMAAGLAVYWPVSYWMLRHLSGADLQSFGGHVIRSASMYLFLVLTGASVARGRSSPDFWLSGQVYLWTGAASLGGIIADAMVRRLRARLDRGHA